MILSIYKKKLKSYLNQIRLRKSSCSIEDYEKLDFGCQLSSCSFENGVGVSKNASVVSSQIGRHTSVGRNTKITHANIGRYCAISWDCTINAISHPMTRLTVSAFPYVPHVGQFVTERNQSYSIVNIGHDVWIGAQAIIMPGVTIGDGAIIGAGAIVTKDVAAYQIVAGNPARPIRFRFNTDVREKLDIVKWWNLPEPIIKENIELFQSDLSDERLDKLIEIARV